MTDPVVISTSVVIAEYPNETFTLGQPIPSSSAILKHWTSVVSASLNIATLSDDMDRAARLLDVGHLASADFPLIQNQIWLILKDYQNAVIATNLAMNLFEIESGHVLANVQASLHYIVEQNFRRSVTMAKRCAASAQKLSAAADEIVKKFDKMAEDAKAAVTASQTATDQNKKQMKALDDQVNDMKADYATQRSLSVSYEQQKTRVQKLYEDTLAQAETAETRAFVSSLVGGICNAAGQGLAAYASARTPSLNIGGLGALAPTQGAAATPETSARPIAKAKPAPVEEEEGEEEEEKPSGKAAKKSTVGEIDAGTEHEFEDALEDEDNPGNSLGAHKDDDDEDEKDDKSAKPAAAKDAPAKKDDAAKDDGKDGKPEEKPKAGKEEDKPLTKEEIDARVKGLAAAADATGKSADKIADKAEAAAIALRKQVSELLNLQFQIEDNRAQALAKMARYTVLLQDNVDTISTIEISVASLAQAIGAMQTVSAIFSSMSGYWQEMEQKCNQLGSDSSFEQNMSDVEGDLAHAVSLIDDIFKAAAIEYCAGWTALNMIATDYSKRMAHLADDVKNFVASHPEESKARAQAKTLAAALGLDVSKAEEATKNRAKRIAAVNKVLMADDTKLLTDGKSSGIV